MRSQATFVIAALLLTLGGSYALMRAFSSLDLDAPGADSEP